MPTKKTTTASRRLRPALSTLPAIHHRLDTLLHTMRCIAQYEDILCEISHEARQTRALSAEIIDELAMILEKIPHRDYVIELDAVRAALVQSRPPKSAKSKRAAKPIAARKKAPVAKRKSGRKSSR